MKPICRLFVSGCIFLLCLPPSVASEEDTEVSSASAILGERLQEILDPLVEERWIPGYYFSLYRDGSEVIQIRNGIVNDEPLSPIDETTLHAVGSMTWPLVSIAIIKLSIEGKINIDGKVGDYLSGVDQQNWQGETPQIGNTKAGTTTQYLSMTIADLLRSYSATNERYQLNSYRLPASEIKSEAQMASSPIARAGKSLNGATHGTTASLDRFGNARETQDHAYVEAYEILGHVIESVSGIPLTDYIEDNVFTLLDMRDSYFSVSCAARDRLARLYSPLFRTFNTPGIPMRHQRNDILPRQIKNFGLEIANPYPSRRLITTARDYQKLLSFLLNPIVEQPSYLNSYKSVISSNLLATLDIGSHKNGESSEGNSGIEEDGDVDVLPKMLGSERTRRYHFFESEFNTAFWIDTKTGSTAVFMTQLYPSHGLPQDKLHQLINEFTDHN